MYSFYGNSGEMSLFFELSKVVEEFSVKYLNGLQINGIKLQELISSYDDVESVMIIWYYEEII